MNKNYIATKLLASVMISNIMTFFIMFIIREVDQTPLVYLTTLAISFALLQGVNFKLGSATSDWLPKTMILITLILLCVPRLTYMMDWVPSLSVMSHSDDYARILQIMTMTENKTYPLKSIILQEYPFSFYYISLYPYAVTKILLQGATIKSIIAWISLAYYSLLLISILEMANGMFRNKLKTRVLIFLITLYGGADWLASGEILKMYGHFEWWQRVQFNGNTQISSFYTTLFWAPHHFIAGYCALCAYYIVFYSRSVSFPRLKYAITAALLSASFYSSPFVFIPVLGLLALHWRHANKYVKNPIALIIFIASIPPLQLFLSKFPVQTFSLSSFRLDGEWGLLSSLISNFEPYSQLRELILLRLNFDLTPDIFIGKILSFPIYLTLVPIVELAGIPLILITIWRQLSRNEKWYLCVAWLYFLTTFLIAFRGANNYSMRGMIIPTFIFFFIAANHSNRILRIAGDTLGVYLRPVSVILLFIFSIGTFKESAGRFQSSLAVSGSPYQVAAPSPNIYKVATDRTVSSLNFSDIQNVPRHNIYDYEKPIVGLRLSDLENYELELMRQPWDD